MTILRFSFLVFLPASLLAKKGGGEAKGCAEKVKGLFAEPRKQSVIPLCDENYPATDSKDSWLVLFYYQSENTEVGKYFDVQFNKLAIDFGNDPPKGKKAKTRKHRKRIEFLADKYEFVADLTLPKKGLSDSTPLLKAGAVCCDCEIVPAKCEGHAGLHLALLHDGKEEKLELDIRKIPKAVRGVLEHFGYVRVGEEVPDGFGESENEEL